MIEDIVKELINGNTVVVKDEQLLEVRERLREIKANCSICLTQFKERLQKPKK